MTFTRSVSAVLLLAATSLSAHAAVRDSETRWGMSETEFRAANDEYFGHGLRLVDITVAEVKGKPVIGAIWQRKSDDDAVPPERVKLLQSLIQLKQDETQLGANMSRLGSSGHALEVLDAYEVGGKTLFATVYSLPNEEPAAVFGVNLSREGVSQLRDEAAAKGYDLVRSEAIGPEVATGYFPSFVQYRQKDVVLVVSLGSAEFNAERKKPDLSGLAPLSISVFRRSDGSPGFAGYFARAPGGELVLDAPSASFGAQITPMIAKGGTVWDIDSFVSNGQVRYSAVYFPAR